MSVSTILVGTDFSDCAMSALMEARALALRLGADVRVLHAYAHPDWSEHPSVARWLFRARLKVHDIVAVAGTPWIELTRYGQDLDALMLCIGSHGTGGFQPLLPGSTTTRILARSTLPVLVVRPERGYPAFDRLQGSSSKTRVTHEPTENT